VAADTGFAVCNAGIIDLGDGVLVFDPFISPRAAADLRRAAATLTGKPVIYVINSHYHNDHIRGNQEFPGAHIISTALTRKGIAENEPEEIAWEKANIAAKLSAAREALAAEHDSDKQAEAKFWVKYYEAIMDSHRSLRTVLPDVTFEGKLVLHGLKRSVELLETGRGHTESDLILYLPTEKIAFMGDLLFINRHPYLPDGLPADWVHALERVSALDVRSAVPGHGPVGDASHLDLMVSYIKAVEEIGAGLAKQRATEQEIASQAVPEAFQTWWYSKFFLPNIKYMVTLAGKQ
jgi:glyoxylase-like metal-dependent hydrolase (beta-lactamase superfamily II)